MAVGKHSTPSLDPGDWFSKDQTERLRWLRHLRQEDPEKARKVLEGSWDAEKPAHKTKLLGVLQIGLSIDDEDFLEHCLHDRRREIRYKSASLLISLKESRVSKALFDFAVDLVRISQNGIAELHLPEELPKEISELVADTGKGKRQNKFGLKASRSYRVLAKIPPECWEQHFALQPPQLLKAFSDGVWKDLLMAAITEATVLHPDVRWMEALSRYWIRTADTQLWNTPTAKQLMHSWPADIFNERCIAFLQHRGHQLDERSLVTYLLKNVNHPWQDKLTLLVIENFQNWLSSSHTVSWGGRFYRDILNAAAFRCNPQLLGMIRRGWRVDVSRWDLWEKELEWLFRTMFFRQEMRSGLIKE